MPSVICPVSEKKSLVPTLLLYPYKSTNMAAIAADKITITALRAKSKSIISRIEIFGAGECKSI